MKITKTRLFLFLAGGMAALGIAGGLAAASALGTAYAHGGYGGYGGGGSDDGNSFAARVAEKLTSALGTDVTEAQVQSAFNGATSDQQVEKLQSKLDELEVDEATQTEILDWFNAYPYADLVRLRMMGLGEADKVSSKLERLVERERITQAQADGIQSWYDDRPELPEGLEHSRSGRGKHGAEGRFGRGHRGHGDAAAGFRGWFDRDGQPPGNPM